LRRKFERMGYVALVNKEPLSQIVVHLRMRPSAKPSPMIHIDYETDTVLVDVEKKSGGGPPQIVVKQVPYTLDSIVEVSCHKYSAINLFLRKKFGFATERGFPCTKICVTWILYAKVKRIQMYNLK